MARRSRTSVLKRQREAAKRQRERRKAEKQAIKRERRHGKAPGTQMASRDDLVGLGILSEPEPTETTETTETTEGTEETVATE